MAEDSVRHDLSMEEILSMQEGLDSLLERIESVQSDHTKLTGEKQFLEDYIGNLMVGDWHTILLLLIAVEHATTAD